MTDIQIEILIIGASLGFAIPIIAYLFAIPIKGFFKILLDKLPF